MFVSIIFRNNNNNYNDKNNHSYHRKRCKWCLASNFPTNLVPALLLLFLFHIRYVSSSIEAKSTKNGIANADETCEQIRSNQLSVLAAGIIRKRHFLLLTTELHVYDLPLSSVLDPDRKQLYLGAITGQPVISLREKWPPLYDAIRDRIENRTTTTTTITPFIGGFTVRDSISRIDWLALRAIDWIVFHPIAGGNSMSDQNRNNKTTNRTENVEKPVIFTLTRAQRSRQRWSVTISDDDDDDHVDDDDDGKSRKRKRTHLFRICSRFSIDRMIKRFILKAPRRKKATTYGDLNNNNNVSLGVLRAIYEDDIDNGEHMFDYDYDDDDDEDDDDIVPGLRRKVFPLCRSGETLDQILILPHRDARCDPTSALWPLPISPNTIHAGFVQRNRNNVANQPDDDDDDDDDDYDDRRQSISGSFYLFNRENVLIFDAQAWWNRGRSVDFLNRTNAEVFVCSGVAPHLPLSKYRTSWTVIASALVSIILVLSCVHCFLQSTARTNSRSNRRSNSAITVATALGTPSQFNLNSDPADYHRTFQYNNNNNNNNNNQQQQQQQQQPQRTSKSKQAKNRSNYIAQQTQPPLMGQSSKRLSSSSIVAKRNGEISKVSPCSSARSLRQQTSQKTKQQKQQPKSECKTTHTIRSNSFRELRPPPVTNFSRRGSQVSRENRSKRGRSKNVRNLLQS